MTPATTLVYWSQATHPMTESELAELLRISRARNEQSQISGMLLYKDGCFLQVLEGEEPQVNAVVKRIEKDPRHHSIHFLSRSEGPRQFTQWSMGFKNLSPDRATTDLLDKPFDPDHFGPQPTQEQALLLCFSGLSDVRTIQRFALTAPSA